jgi:hypothetical protein
MLVKKSCNKSIVEAKVVVKSMGRKIFYDFFPKINLDKILVIHKLCQEFNEGVGAANSVSWLAGPPG